MDNIILGNSINLYLQKHESCLSVGLSVCLSTFFSTHSFMKFWFKASFEPGWNMTKPDFFIFTDSRGLFVFFQLSVSCFFGQKITFLGGWHL